MGDVKHEPPQKRARSLSSTNSDPNDFKLKLNEFRKRGYLCDFTIEIPDHEFHVHRCVLAARSRHFENTFNTSATKMRWDHLKAVGVERCLHYLYTGEFMLDPNTVESTLFAADAFKVSVLRRELVDYILKSLNPGNCLGTERLACRLKIDDLQKRARDMIVSKFAEVIESDKYFCTISKTDLTKYMSSVNDPAVVRNGTLKWFGHPQNVKRMRELPSFLIDIHFSKFPAEELIDFHKEATISKLHEGAEYIGKEIVRQFRRCQLKVTTRNWKLLMDLFQNLQQTNEERAIKSFVINNLAAVTQLDSFYEIGINDLIFYLKSIRLPLSKESENIIWSTLVRWIKFSRSRRTMLSDLLQAINLNSFSLDFLQKVVKNDELVTKDTKSLNLLVHTLCQLL